MTSRKYFYCVSIILFAFMLANLILWHGYIKKIFNQGEMYRMANYPGTSPQTPGKKYSRHRTELKDYLSGLSKESFDVITIGDSFSNTPFQNYLEEQYNLNILNARFNKDCLIDLYILIQSGLLDEIKPKAVIIESVARSVPIRLGQVKEDLPEINRAQAEKIIFAPRTNTAARISSSLIPPVMTNRNINFVYYRICNYVFGSDRLSPDTYIAKLDRNLFTNSGQENLLLYYYEDLLYLNKRFNSETAGFNLNKAAKLLASRNIKLIFMPCVDKYDLYYPYIINKRNRPENNLFTQLENLEIKANNYSFINTKKILRNALERGEKDLYWAGDTHWSWRGWEIVCDELVKKLQ